MFRQYYASRFRPTYPAIAKTVRRKTVYYTDPRDKQVGNIPVGCILIYTGRRTPLKRTYSRGRLPGAVDRGGLDSPGLREMG